VSTLQTAIHLLLALSAVSVAQVVKVHWCPPTPSVLHDAETAAQRCQRLQKLGAEKLNNSWGNSELRRSAQAIKKPKRGEANYLPNFPQACEMPRVATMLLSRWPMLFDPSEVCLSLCLLFFLLLNCVCRIYLSKTIRYSVCSNRPHLTLHTCSKQQDKF